MLHLIFATHNDHKLLEVKKMLDAKHFSITSLREIDYHEDIVEDGDTMEANALIKARTIHTLLGKAVISEDSGLEVEALDMEPGIYTARYAGPQRDADDNMDKVLGKLKGNDNRKARFRACVVYITEKGKEYTFEGIINGSIAESKRGNEGFGYDPIFIPEGYERSYAELPESVKYTDSHRAKAMIKLVNHLTQNK